MKIISYSLFKYVNQGRLVRVCSDDKNSLDFERYLRGLWLNFRISRLILPDWKIIVNVDTETYKEYASLFGHFENFGISIHKNNVSTISESSLWRLKPIWYEDVSVIICRDLDSCLSYRESQMTKEWLESDKISHAIADSEMHCITMLTGMIGFKKEFVNIFLSWENMIQGFDYTFKGIDQSMLCHKVYPKLAEIDSILQHYIHGHSDTGLTGFRTTYNDDDLPNIDKIYRKTNEFCGFIGSYYNDDIASDFLNKYDIYNNEYKEIEERFDVIRFSY